MSSLQLFGTFQKVDSTARVVRGYASTEAKDNAGEIILKSAVQDALAGYLEFGNIREMHSLSAVGTTIEASVDDKGLYIGAKIVDDAAWAKVEAGVYKGFSVGGKTLARDPKDKHVITKILLNEISLVDRPANSEARFDVWKAAGTRPATDAEKIAAALASMSEDERAMAITKAALATPHKIGTWK